MLYMNPVEIHELYHDDEIYWLVLEGFYEVLIRNPPQISLPDIAKKKAERLLSALSA